MGYPKTRQEAKETNSKYYFTGVPCKHGHIALRITKGSCVECRKDDSAKQMEKRKSQPKSEASKAAGRRYYEKNRAVVIARAQSRPVEDKKRYKLKYKKINPELYKALTSNRKRRHREATPKWVTAEEKLLIRELYLQASWLSKTTGERYVVDHIIPLHGETVCGLHTIRNLRVITQAENLEKSNKLDESHIL